jgi:hypothetical protein
MQQGGRIGSAGKRQRNASGPREQPVQADELSHFLFDIIRHRRPTKENGSDTPSDPSNVERTRSCHWAVAGGVVLSSRMRLSANALSFSCCDSLTTDSW